jgi:hypothetical protein
MLLTCVFAGGYLRGFRFVVRAAGALTALGVPPFRIWHDFIQILLRRTVGNTTTIDLLNSVFCVFLFCVSANHEYPKHPLFNCLYSNL